MKKRMVSGIKPSGDVHLGNYLGAIAQWVKLQDEFDVFIFVADLHAVTVPQDPQKLHRSTLDIVKTYLAAGLDPSKVTIFAQSHIREHAELGWLLNTITRMGDLEKMTQFKDKGGENRETAGVGLFDYPVLMAGDIMLYDADSVPVGEDQVQHIELARSLCRRFNKRFAPSDREPIFLAPKAQLQTAGARIMALDNPHKKMSKSAASANGYIALNDTPEQARKKIMRAVTDSGTDIVFRPEKPALENLMTIYSLLSGEPTFIVENMYRGKGYAEFKKDLADLVVTFLEEFQAKFDAISDEDVMKVLRDGAAKAHPIAEAKMRQVKEAMGFVL